MTTKAIVDALIAEMSAGFVQAKTAAAAKPPDLAGMTAGFLKASTAANRLAALVPVDGVQPPPIVDPPRPVDCVLSAWGGWTNDGAPTPCVAGTQQQPQKRTRTVVTQPANGGAACGPLSETRSISVSCSTPPVEEPPPDQPPANVPPSGLLASVAYGVESAQFNFSGKGDYYDAAKLPGYIPFSHFDDPNLGIIARSAHGQVQTKPMRRVHIGGSTFQLYQKTSVIEDGKINQRNDMELGAADDMRLIAAGMRRVKPRLGRRGEGYPGAFVTLHSHPNATTAGSQRSPLFMGLRADALFFGALPTGDTQPMLQLTTIEAAHDFTLTDDPKVLYVTDFYQGRIVRVQRQGLVIQSETSFGGGGFGSPSSCRWLPKLASPRLVVCDQQDRVWIVNPTTGTKEILTDKIRKPGWVFDTSDPNVIVVMSWADSGVFFVNVSSGEVGPDIFPTAPSAHMPVGFGTICVDVEGTCGPVDDMLLMRTHDGFGGTNNAVHHYDATTKTWDFAPFNPPNPARPGERLPLNGVGRGQEVMHYGWGAEYHRQQGVRAVWGLSQTAITYVRNALPNDPPEDAFEVVGNSDPGAPNRNTFNLGLQALIYGAPCTVPVGKYPSVMCAINSSMWGGVFNADAFGAMTNAERKDWIYNGFGGIHPRPEFRDDDYVTHAIGYAMLVNSQEWLRRGMACTDEWRASFPAAMTPKTILGINPNNGQPEQTPFPQYPNYNSHYLQVRPAIERGAGPGGALLVNNADGLHVVLQDKDFGLFALPPNTVVRLVADFDTPFQRELGTVNSGASPTSDPIPVPLNLPPGRYVISALAAGVPNMAPKATLIDV